MRIFGDQLDRLKRILGETDTRVPGFEIQRMVIESMRRHDLVLRVYTQHGPVDLGPDELEKAIDV